MQLEWTWDTIYNHLVVQAVVGRLLDSLVERTHALLCALLLKDILCKYLANIK